MSEHITVLKDESLRALNLHGKATVVDATANGGGHSLAILEQWEHEGEKGGTLLSIDIDRGACVRLHERLKSRKNVRIVNDNFRNIDAILKKESLETVDGILADLGWSTNQFETAEGNPGRGFSFLKDEPLLMTYGEPESYPFTAKDIVNRWEEEDIANVLYGYADERASRKIARAIVEVRKKEYIASSAQLANIVLGVTKRKGKLHPATKTFQALRIAVNDELGALTEFIQKSIACLAPRGRLAIITFHSIEDRVVKQAFKAAVQEGKVTNPIKKPIAPSREETKRNPRARSAKLRILEKT